MELTREHLWELGEALRQRRRTLVILENAQGPVDPDLRRKQDTVEELIAWAKNLPAGER